jgi:hypothetical protein
LTTLGQVKQTALPQNYPNPFNPETWMPYILSEDSSVTICTYTASGQLVRTLALGWLSNHSDILSLRENSQELSQKVHAQIKEKEDVYQEISCCQLVYTHNGFGGSQLDRRRGTDHRFSV